MSTRIDVKFAELNQSFKPSFGEMQTASDGGYERGYEDGKQYADAIILEMNNEIALQKELLEQAALELEGKVDPELYNQGYEDGAASVPDYLAMRVSNTLTEYSNDKVNTIADYAFYYCSKLETIDFPNCTHVGNYAFQYCSALKEVNFPLVTSVGSTYSYSFGRCTKLEKADFGCVESIGGYAFQLCSALQTLIIRTPTVCTLQGVSAINSSAINSGKGYIYVPDDLVDEYKAATNWSTFAAQIKPLSELEA